MSNEDDILEGIYINIPPVQYTLDDLGKNRIDLNGIQAALLDIDCRTFSRLLGYQICKYLFKRVRARYFCHFMHPFDGKIKYQK